MIENLSADAEDAVIKNDNRDVPPMPITEFLRMMEQDIVTISSKEKPTYIMLLECIKQAAAGYSGMVDPSKTLNGALKRLESHAKNIKVGNCAVVCLTTAIRLVKDYLGIRDEDIATVSNIDNFNLDDFM